MKKLSVIVVASVLIFGMASNAYAGMFYAYADTVLSYSPDKYEVDSASGTHLGTWDSIHTSSHWKNKFDC